MARIIIKGRKEAIELENERAQNLKNRWLGLGDTPKADPNDVVDLGEWAGEYGRIVEIEMTREVVNTPAEDPFAKQERERLEQEARWRKMTPEEKSKSMGKFRLKYMMMSKGQQASEEVMAKVEAALLKFYKKAKPDEHAPDTVWYPFLPRPVVPEKPKPLICKSCKVKEAKKGSLFCSGKCELDSKNGQISTA